MRRPFLLALVVLSVLLVFAGAILLLQRPLEQAITATSTAAGEVRRITAEELRVQLATSSPPQVWDLRSAETYAQGHIPGSRLINLDEIPGAAAKLDKRQAIVALCA
jgi:3-mercaptopyruvate sulfurtransferase SseA